MKKLLFLSALILITATLFAQTANTTPRWGVNGDNNDKTGRILTYNWTPFTVPSNDSLKVLNWNYNVFAQETDTLQGALLVLNFPKYVNPIAGTYVGDIETFQFKSGTNTNVVTFGHGYNSNSTLSVTGGKVADIVFIFDNSGTWRELSRSVH